MTENRYVTILLTGDIHDTVTNEFLRGNGIARRLNELQEENELLKCEVYSYKCSTETDKEIIEDLHKEYKVLKKKHEELKIQINELNQQLYNIKNIIRGQFESERTELGRSVLRQLLELVGGVDG